MTDEDDFGSAGYDRLTTLLAGVISAIHDRPADALMLMKEAYAIYRVAARPRTQAARRDVPASGGRDGSRRETALTAPERYPDLVVRASRPGGCRLAWATPPRHTGLFTQLAIDASRFAVARSRRPSGIVLYSCPLPV